MGFALSKMQIVSPAFKFGSRIPRKHTQEGENVSPALEWTDIPEETRALAVICHDPDAPLVKDGGYGYVHWVLYNIPPSVTGLSEGFTGYTSGVNDKNTQGYIGPMPPKGHGTHQYYFWILALSENINFEPGLTMQQYLKKAEPYLVGMNRLVGIYERQ